jgi:autotransporter-associated beta strand protein
VWIQKKKKKGYVMKKIMFALLVSTAVLLSAIPCSAQAPKIRIMPLGDSITYGSSVAGGYRLPLYIALTNLGYNVDFVGSAYDNAAAGLGAEINHEGHGGWHVSAASNGLYENILTWLSQIEAPDVVLVHIGTNDTGDAPNYPGTINELDALITRISAARPYAHIIVTTLLKRGATDLDSKNVLIDTYFNPYVQGVVQTHALAGHRVHFLDMHAYVDRYPGGGLSSDQLHPDAQGYAQMAAAWLPAITNIVSPYGDFVPPAVASVRMSSATTLTVMFSKPINLAVSPAVANPASWTVSPGGTVTAVSALSADLRTVTLSVSGLSLGPVSTLAFTGTITDLVPVAQGGPFTASLSGAVGAFSLFGLRAWSGLGADALWTTAANWTGYTVPTTSYTVLFSGAGNNKTNLTLGTGATAAGITFASDAAAYTLGLPSETLSLPAARITLDVGSVNNQNIAATLLLGGNLDIFNNEPSKRLTLNYTNNAARSIYVYGTGPVTFDTLRRPAGTETNDTNYIRLELRSPAPVTCTGPITIGQLWKDNAYLPSELILAPHTTNVFCRNDWEFALSGATISGGEGTVLRLLHGQANTPAAIALQTANPVTISCRLECPTGLATLNKGGGGWVNGTLVLTYPDNDIPGNITFDRGNCLQVPFVAPNGTPNPLGSSPAINFSNPLNGTVPARLRVTSATSSSTDKAFTISQDRAAIQNAGTGMLTLSGPISGNGAIVFETTAGNIVYSGVRSGTGGITKEETFALSLSGPNTSTGPLTLSAGATTLSGSWAGPATLAANASLAISGTLASNLTLSAGATLSGTVSGAVTVNASASLTVLPGATLSGPSVLLNGSTLTLNPTAADSFTLALPPLIVTNANAFLSVSAAATASSVTISNLTLNGKTLFILAPAAGTVRNRIFFTGLANGPVSGILLNGLPAAYSDSDGIYAAASTLPPATVIDNQIPNAPGSAATVSDTPASTLTLAQPSVTLGQLDYAAPSSGVLDLGGGVLGVSNLIVSGAAFTVSNGTLTAAAAPHTKAFYAGINQPQIDIFTDDASTGISPSKTYTHLLDPGLASNTVAVINGVTFTKITNNTTYTDPGTGFGWTGIPAGSHDLNLASGWTNTILRPAGNGLYNLVNGMGYAGNNMIFTLSGLTPGAVYEFRAYGREWDNIPSSVDRTHVWTFYTTSNAAPVASFAFDQNHTPPHALTLRYVAASSNLTVKTWRFAQTANPDPGIYGITNEKLADAPAGVDVSPATLTLSASDGALTVAAAVGDPARPVSLASSGDVTLEGPVTLYGTTFFSGDLDLAPSAADTTQYLGGAVSGSGALVKSGPGSAVLLAANTYLGSTAVSGGILNGGTSTSFGTGPVNVLSGGAVGLADALLNTIAFGNVFTIAGSGPDGLGALRNDTTALQINAFKYVTLVGDATIGGGTSYSPSIPIGSILGQNVQKGRFDIRNGTLDFGGHSLTKAGNSALILTSDKILGVSGDTSVDVTGGTFGLEVSTDLGGSAANTLTVRSGAAFDFFDLATPIRWSLVAENGTHLSTRSGNSTTLNNWAGPVRLQSGIVTLDGPNTLTFSGPISGAGGFVQGAGTTYLRNPTNTFTGPTTFTGGTLYSLYDGTIPNPAGFTLSGGTFYAYLGDGVAPAKGWTSAGINALVTQGAITAGDGPSFSLDATAYVATINGALPSCRIRKYGTNILTRNAGTPSPGILHVHDGTLALTSGLWDAAANNKALYVGAENNSNYLGRVTLSSDASFRHRDPGYKSTSSYTIIGGTANSRGILAIGDSASYTGRLYAGNSASAAGAVYQTGGTVLDLGGYNTDSRFGVSGFGYLDISGGSFTTKGYTQFGNASNSYGTLHMTGGTFTFNSGAVPADGFVGDCYGGTLSVRGGNGHLFLEGGSLTTGSTNIQLPEDQTQNAPLSAILTVSGTADVSTAWLLTGNYQMSTPTSFVNLNGGRLTTGYIQKGNGTGVSANNANAQTYINFNGGKLALTADGAVVRKSGTAPDPRLTVYEGGAVIDANTHSLTLDYPLAAPSGMGVAAISISNPGAGYIAPPFVLISGGGGTGAVAVAVLDAVPGKVIGFRILCPGSGYTSAPTVTLGGGGFITVASGATAVIGPVAITGGLALSGPGSLTLTAANTYRGPTVVTNATLALAPSGSITDTSALILANASFSAPGRDLTNALLRVSGNSSLSVGSLTAASLDKTGSGTLTLNARLALTTNAPAPVSTDFTPVPGLAEGFVVGTGTNSTTANPRFAIVPTWRALNGYVGSGTYINGAQWPDNTTYIYSGYLWNRQSSSVTWTFACNMDDHIQLKIDDAVVVERGSFITTSDTPLKTVTLTPGPHKFELRAGQGGGSVGGYWTRSDGSRIGIGVDKLNRGLAWSTGIDFADTLDQLEDPGDGSLFTVNSPYSDTLGLIPATGTVGVPTNILAKVGAVADGFSVTYGTDVFPSISTDIYNCNAALWQTNNSANAAPFDRVAYYLELVKNSTTQYVWVAFDAHTVNRRALAFPGKLAGERFLHQRKVSNLTVRSNVSNITELTDSSTGNIEVYPANYSNGTMPANGLNGRTDIYDFDDTPAIASASGSLAPDGTGYGCLQVHNWGTGETLFAVNNFGTVGSTLCMGIGNRPGAVQLPSNPQLDYTFDPNAAGYTVRRFYILTRDLVLPPKPASVATITEGTLRVADVAAIPVPEAIRTKVGSVASDYDVVYASAVPTTAATIVSGTAYSIDNSNDTTSFDRVAYYLELVKNATTQYVWVAFDPHTTDRKKLGYPSQTGNLFAWQQKVYNMDVVCNVPGVPNRTASATGNIEIWPNSYSAGTNALKQLGGSNTAYDFDDTMTGATPAAGHGCFQIHNWGDKVTLLAITHLGTSANPLGVGIGNDGGANPDYTFNDNATQFTVRNFYVCVRPTVRSTGSKLASVDLTIAAGATFDLGGGSQTVRSITGAGTISNGVLAAGTVISPAGDGTVGTQSLANVQIASGVQYRADLGDLLNVTGALDVTGMVLHINNPESLERSQIYTLIQTTGGVTGLPTLDTPLPSGWKVVRRGNALLLLRDAGTLILYK